MPKTSKIAGWEKWLSFTKDLMVNYILDNLNIKSLDRRLVFGSTAKGLTSSFWRGKDPSYG